MNCKHFGECGACVVYEGGYEAQLSLKVETNKERFADFYAKPIKVFRSLESHYRSRSEYKIWHVSDNTIFYAMSNKEKNGSIFVEECPQVNTHISLLMPTLLRAIQEAQIGHKLFGIDFLSSADGDMVVSLLYHKRVGIELFETIKEIAKRLNISIIARSRGQKETAGKDYVIEKLNIQGRQYRFKYIENSFTQPNHSVNEQMIGWALEELNSCGGDLLELYCGAGNFTIPFASKFNKILATEISKSSIAAAQENMRLNGVENIEFVRMSVEEFVSALEGERVYNRMKHIRLEDYRLKTIFVDPPRSGMDEASCNFASGFDDILYISCNPVTLYRDLEILTKTHEVVSMALFDQFPYTHHAEMGARLRRRER
ncbi:MAG: tRNA (uridine(54)-C5)-methyltransferase TrmA [Epsilonproteobacteria bacterium]|nr:tRNA (uridine(54)-C5)-methyltransferase TrmA [Campylobacterota bacterium]